MTSNAYKRASQIIQKAKGPKWKRELVSDHKFDFIDIEEFRDRTFLLTVRYIMLFFSVVISAMVYGADLWSAAILLIYDVRTSHSLFLVSVTLMLPNYCSTGHFQHNPKFLLISVNGSMLSALLSPLCCWHGKFVKHEMSWQQEIFL